MKNVSRRALMSMLPPLAVAPALMGASCQVGTVTVGGIASDVDIIAKGVDAVLPLIEKITGMTDATIAKVKAINALIKSKAEAIASSATTDVVSTVKAIGAGVGDIVAALGGFKVPDWISTVLKAAGGLVPTVLGTLGVVTPAAAAPVPGAMTPAQMRAILVAASAK